MTQQLESLLLEAQAARPGLQQMGEAGRGAILKAMAKQLQSNAEEILKANEQDLENAKGRISDVMLDRLRLTKQRIDDMAAGVLAVEALPSPLGMVEREYTHANGLLIKKVRVPIGVIAIIYESRPNVTSDAAALCIKSGNACVLRGGSDAIRTNTAVVAALQKAVAEAGGPAGAVQLVQDTTHQSAQQLMKARGLVDMLIPRGGAGLIKAVVEGAQGVPVIETGTGVCHVYVDKDADLKMAADILYNAKTNRPSVCNAAEVCLVHSDVAAEFLPMAKAMLDEKNVELRLDKAAQKIISGTPAGADDFDTEFLDYVLAVGVVGSAQQAIEHINRHSTHHSDAVVTENAEVAQEFLNGVDSAAVYVNASTRFTDGGEFGLGCEMGISTQKVGARGPMGLYELTSYKYTVKGNGQVR